MPFVARSYKLPSTLWGIIGQVKDAFSAMGDATPIMIGKAYAEQNGVGSGPRVLFLPEHRGRVGEPFRMGYACSIYHGCEVRVRAAENADDLARFDNVAPLTDRVLDCIATAGTGHITWNDYEPNPPTANDAFGAEIIFTFTYRRDVRHDEARWALPPATLDTDAPIPIQPPGEAATDLTLDTTVIPTE
jgi:hypothetical protein